jgi:predicted transcriptional regulator
MRISEIRDILEASVLWGDEHLGKIVAGGGGADLMDDVLAAVAEDAVLLTGLTTEKVLRTAKLVGVNAIVFVRGKEPEASEIQLAQSYGIPLLRTRYSLFVACGRLYMNGLRGLDGSW